MRSQPGVPSRHKGQGVSAEIANHEGVLHDADASLACWLARVLPAGTKVRFDAPNAGWAERPPDPPFIGAFLYDVREDAQGNHAGWSDVRDTEGRVTGRQSLPRSYKLRYLLTAWTADSTAMPGEPGMAAHQLLGALMSVCVATDLLPADCLRGALDAAGLPTLLRCAPADGQTDPARLWAGFGLAPRAFLELLLIVPVLPPPDRDLASPAREIALNMTKPGTGGSKSEADINGAVGAEGRRGRQGPARRRERSTITEHTTWPDHGTPEITSGFRGDLLSTKKGTRGGDWAKADGAGQAALDRRH